MNGQKQQTVIVVNDDSFQLSMESKILEKDGLEVISCQSAEDAIRIMYNRGPVDAIATEIYTPGIDGWRFCRLHFHR
jgi:PleD family two-component response regulator